ncbi:hypothetical protein J2T20_000444 [Paenibacillus wynnii]|nr:hypothetical protein [Paenibacillus wynnii]
MRGVVSWIVVQSAGIGEYAGLESRIVVQSAGIGVCAGL